MALGMFGDVHQQADDSGRQMFSSDPARLPEAGGIYTADGLLRAAQRLLHAGKQVIQARAWRHLGRQRGQLLRIQRPACEIGGQAIQAARKVAQMKAQRRQPVGPSPHLAVAEPGGVACQILARLLKPV